MMLDPASTTISLLHPGEVHLWWYASPAIAPRVRRTYIDAVLRITLSRYVAMPPQALRFGRESRGRPFLLDVDGAPDFNLSDTEGGTVVAVARGLRVGIDLERMDRQPGYRWHLHACAIGPHEKHQDDCHPSRRAP